jgi:hypothetical protein
MYGAHPTKILKILNVLFCKFNGSIIRMYVLQWHASDFYDKKFYDQKTMSSCDMTYTLVIRLCTLYRKPKADSTLSVPCVPNAGNARLLSHLKVTYLQNFLVS